MSGKRRKMKKMTFTRSINQDFGSLTLISDFEISEDFVKMRFSLVSFIFQVAMNFRQKAKDD